MSKDKTAAARNAAARARKTAAGLAKLELWVPRELHEQIKRMAAHLVELQRGGLDEGDFEAIVKNYVKLPLWTPREAARLLAEQGPRRSYADDAAPETGVARHVLNFMLSFPDCRFERTPAEWVGWAVANELYVHESLRVALTD